MARTLEHPEVRAERQQVREAPERLPSHEELVPRRPTRWMRWMAAAVVVLIGAGLAVLALRGDTTTEYAVPQTADGTERWLEYSEPQYAVPRTADGAERWYAYELADYRVPRTADGSEGWYLSTLPVPDYRVPRTADGWEMYLAHNDYDGVVPRTADGSEGWAVSTLPAPELPTYRVPRTADGWEMYLAHNDYDGVVPRTADGAERWLTGVDTTVMPTAVRIHYLPVGQLVTTSGDWEITYLPVSQPVISVPGAEVVLVVQPVLRQVG